MCVCVCVCVCVCMYLLIPPHRKDVTPGQFLSKV